MLTIPFRRSATALLSSAIRPYIDTKYGQHPDMFAQDLEAIDSLRYHAMHVQEAHSSGARKLMAYAAQLAWIGGKFPIDVGVSFAWWPALGYNTRRPVSRDNLKYELLNVLFNLAALLTQLADGCTRTTTDGLKQAAAHLSSAAGVLSHMDAQVLPNLRMSDPPDDMDHHTLDCLSKLCLAQAQECFWQKAVMDGYKDALISRLAASVSDLYADAMDAAQRTEAISSAWIHVMAAKHQHFAAAAQYRMSRDCLEKRRYGDEISRLKDAVACANAGLAEMKGQYVDKAIAEDLNTLKKKVEEDLKRAEKDNDVIYLNSVPAKSDLPLLDRAKMAAAKVPPEVATPLDFLGENTPFGPALFAKLVPFAVHNAVSIYEERRDRLVGTNIVQELQSLNTKMRDFLRDLNLPGSLQALEKPLGLPNNVTQHAEELRQSDGVAGLERSFREMENLRADNMQKYEEGKALLETEAEEDRQLRTHHGTSRWTRPDGPNDRAGKELYLKADEIQGYLEHSGSSDAIVRAKFDANLDHLGVLIGPDRGLLDFIPSSRTVELPEMLKAAIGQLRRAYNDVLRLESRRRKKLDAIEDMRRRDDVKPDILKEAARLERECPNAEISAALFDEFFNQRLDRNYDEHLEGVEKETAEQERLLLEVERTNREFEAQRKRMGGVGGEAREKALQVLENAFSAYKEVRHNLGLARSFYNDLLTVTGNLFLVQVRAWVDERRASAKELEEEINMPALSRLSLAAQHRFGPETHQAASAQPQHAPEPQQSDPPHHQPVPGAHVTVHDTATGSSPSPAPTPFEARIQSWAGNVMAAPLPQSQAQPPRLGAWTPDMGIRFAHAPPPPASASGQEQTAPAGQNQRGRVQAWDPSAGIHFM